MSKCLDRNKDFLIQLSLASEKERQKLIENASPDQIRVLTEISANILNGKFDLRKRHVKKLINHKHIIRKLSQSHVSHKAKKALLNQSGGFLPFLITPVLSALGAIAGKVIGSQLGL